MAPSPRRVGCAVLLAGFTGLATLTGCADTGPLGPGATPGAQTAPARNRLPSRVAASPVPTPNPPAPIVTGPTTAFPEHTTAPCTERPSAAQVIAVLRGSTALLPAGARVSVRTGPLCAGTWQYTVLEVPGRDQLQVLTRGQSGALELVTAGTDICTSRVLALAPAGIRTATRC